MRVLFAHQNLVGPGQTGNARGARTIAALLEAGCEVNVVAADRTYLGIPVQGPRFAEDGGCVWTEFTFRGMQLRVGATRHSRPVSWRVSCPSQMWCLPRRRLFRVSLWLSPWQRIGAFPWFSKSATFGRLSWSRVACFATLRLSGACSCLS
jgi:hypothetical protein